MTLRKAYTLQIINGALIMFFSLATIAIRITVEVLQSRIDDGKEIGISVDTANDVLLTLEIILALLSIGTYIFGIVNSVKIHNTTTNSKILVIFSAIPLIVSALIVAIVDRNSHKQILDQNVGSGKNIANKVFESEDSRIEELKIKWKNKEINDEQYIQMSNSIREKTDEK